jgi:hypothetical protein
MGVDPSSVFCNLIKENKYGNCEEGRSGQESRRSGKEGRSGQESRRSGEEGRSGQESRCS